MSNNQTIFTLEEYNYCLNFTQQPWVKSLDSVTEEDTSKLIEIVDHMIWYRSRTEGKFEYTLCKNKENFRQFFQKLHNLGPQELLTRLLFGEMMNTFKATEVVPTPRTLFCMEFQAKEDAADMIGFFLHKTLYHVLLERYPEFTDVIQEVFAISYACDKIANQLKSEQASGICK